MEDISVVNTNAPVTQAVSFEQDMLKISLSAIFGLFLILGANFLILTGGLLNLILGVILMFWGLSSLSRVYKEVGSALTYRKARENVNGLYLRKNYPVCPYLKSSHSGFTCQLEFIEPFDVASDLPRCHIESRYKAHWVDKAPNVYLQAQESTDMHLINYLKVLGNVKYEPAIPLLLKILDTPEFSEKSLFIYENANNEDKESMKNLYFDNYAIIEETLTEEEQIEQEKFYNQEFDSLLDTLITAKFILVENENLSRADEEDVEKFKAKWKFYAQSIVKQFALVSLGSYEDPNMIPRFLKIYLESKDNKMVKIARKSLANFSSELEKPIIDLLEDESLSSNQKTSLLDMAGDIDSDSIFSKLVEIAESDDETMSYYAISALGRKGQKGIKFILEILQNQPTELKLDSGRSTLILEPELSFQSIKDVLKEKEEISDEYAQILSSILEDFDHTTIKKYYTSLSDTEKTDIEQIFDNHNLNEELDYLVSR